MTRAPSKELSIDDVVGHISSGMTLGIGGWGSRRKPMALVRAILRSDLTDLHIVSYAGPDVGLLLDAGKASKITYAFSTRSPWSRCSGRPARIALRRSASGTRACSRRA